MSIIIKIIRGRERESEGGTIYIIIHTDSWREWYFIKKNLSKNHACHDAIDASI